MELLFLGLSLLLGYLYYQMRSESRLWELSCRKAWGKVAELGSQTHSESDLMKALRQALKQKDSEMLKLQELVQEKERELESLRYRT